MDDLCMLLISAGIICGVVGGKNQRGSSKFEIQSLIIEYFLILVIRNSIVIILVYIIQPSAN